MKLSNAEYEMSSNINKKEEYQISNSGKMYEILYHNIYSDPIAAVVREICSNAYDSHCQAGFPEKPFRVVLPNPFRPFFEVEDFGVGMTEEDVRRVYTRYGSSTKSETDSLVGGFGLGSKTPFAYGKTFNTRVRKDGVQCTFLNFIGDDGRPSITKLSETKTDQPNGVKITVPVNKGDFDNFSRKASYYLSFYKVRPEVVGNDFKFQISQSDINQLYKYGIARFKQFNGIVMGCVPFSGGDLSISPNSVLLDIGSIRPTASRERLDFSDEETNKRITAIVDERKKAAKESMLAEYCSSPKISAKLSALKNSGSMDMILSFLGLGSLFDSQREFASASKVFQRCVTYNSSEGYITNLGSLVYHISNGDSITVLYGNGSNYKKTACVKHLFGSSYDARRNYGNPETYIVPIKIKFSRDRIISTFKKIFPEGELGISWKSIDEVYAAVPKVPRERKTIAGTGWFSDGGSFKRIAIDFDSPEMKNYSIILSKAWNNMRTRNLIIDVTSVVPSDKPILIINNSRKNEKLLGGLEYHDIDDWKVKMDQDKLELEIAKKIIPSWKTPTISELAPIILKFSKQPPEIVDLVNRLKKIVSQNQCWHQHYKLHSSEIRKHIDKYDEIDVAIKHYMNMFDEWYDEQKKIEPILKYVNVSTQEENNIEDVIFYLSKRNDNVKEN